MATYYALLNIDNLAGSRVLTAAGANALKGTLAVDITGFTAYVPDAAGPPGAEVRQPTGPIVPPDGVFSEAFSGRFDGEYLSLLASSPYPGAFVIQYEAAQGFAIASSGGRYVNFMSIGPEAEISFITDAAEPLGITSLKAWEATGGGGSEGPPLPDALLASADLGGTLLYFALSGSNVGARPEYTTFAESSPAAGVSIGGANIAGTTHQNFPVGIDGDIPGVRIEFVGGSSALGFPVIFRPNGDYSYSPNEHGLLDGIAPGSTIVVEASANLIRTKVNGGAWVNTDLTDLKGSWLSDLEKNNFWRRIGILSVPIPPIVLDSALYVGDVGPTVPVPAWSANNVRVYVLGAEPPPGFWTNFVLSSETP